MKYLLLCLATLLLSCQTGNKQGNAGNDTKGSSEEMSYQDIQKEYTRMYTRKTGIDTTIRIHSTKFNFLISHYCLFDTLVIPAEYSWGESQENFTTHNFASKLTVIKANQVLLDTVISREMFFQLLEDDNLRMFGVLQYPVFRGYNRESNVVQIQYSLSVPLTDVGKSVTVNIGPDGEISTSLD